MAPPIIVISNDALTLRLTSVTISQTYGGVLEGVPSRRLNDRKLASLVQQHSSPGPVHLIDPPRRLRENRSRHWDAEFWGPQEELPPLQCIGLFEGPRTSKAPSDESFDHWFTELTVIWFQDPNDALIHPDLISQILAVPWDGLARDVSISDM